MTADKAATLRPVAVRLPGDDLPSSTQVQGTSVFSLSDEERPRSQAEEEAYWAAAEPDIEAGLWETVEAQDTDVAVCVFEGIRFPLKLPNGQYATNPDGSRKTVPMRIRFNKIKDSVVEAAQGKARRRVQNRTIRNGPPEYVVDESLQRSWIIYEATVPEDKATYWDVPARWDKYKVGNGPELIEKLLSLGQKLQAVATIYGHSDLLVNEDETDRVVKPSAGQAAS